MIQATKHQAVSFDLLQGVEALRGRVSRSLERIFGDLGFLGILASFMLGVFLDPVRPLSHRFAQGFVSAALMLSAIYWVRGPESKE